ncbi:MAG: hypothetical protein JSU85_06595 [Candidatus Zixiibacteriota bacterium]|nr:MAG: hypothetical protein JSU85_06595 [candidate division Zixibacteria bacterium]
MEESDRHKAIQILFRYIDDYEGGSKFEGEEFINYFENVLAHLKLVRDQNSLDIIKGVDDTLVTQFDKVPFTSPTGGTDIRYFTAHILATFFPVLIPMSAQFQEAYRFCLKLRHTRSDLDFMESELVPNLFLKDVLRRSNELRYYFLSKVSEMQNLNNDPVILDDPYYQSLDKLREVAPSKLLLSLRRRQLKSDYKELLQDKNSAEYKLSEYNVFSRLADSSLVYQDILHKMGYIRAELPIADRLKRILINLIQFITGIVKAPRYMFFIFGKSRGNYIYFTLTLLIIVIILVSIFQWLGSYNEKKLKNFEQKIESLR